jgi:hypothetical protein
LAHELAREPRLYSAGALKKYGGWSGKPEEFEGCLHRCFTPFMPEQEHREQMFKALRVQGDPAETSLVNLRSAKQLADLFLVHTAKCNWQSILENKESTSPRV